jgi:hypothetical protein
MESKKIWQSKTVWVSILVAIAPLYPPLGAFVTESPAIASFIVSTIFGALRLVTNKPIGA